VTELISQHFGFYHAGIFMVDEARRYAVLRAANSDGGRRMLARGHKLAVGSQGIVGYVTGTGEPRIALDVGADAVFFNNPDLPETRSEMALPLRAGGQTIGALDVQSVEAGAFDDQDVAVLSALADQVAIAIENARLFRQSQEALTEVEEAQRRYLQEAWRGFLQQRPDLQFEYALEGVPSALDVELPTTRQAVEQGELAVLSEATEGDDGSVARAALSVPIKLRGQVIGVLDLHEADEARVWTEHEIALAQAVADQMAQALEAARLFEQTQARAQRERLVGQITTRMRAAPNVQDILRVASEELGKALGVTRSVVRLHPREA
jgi:GAF domain-containing protein